MDEDIAIIDTRTRNEKIKNFFVKYKRLLIVGVTLLVLLILSFYSYKIFKDNQRELTSEKYNNAVIQYKNSNQSEVILLMKEVINIKDSTYSPLALYFLIDNNLIKNKNEVINLFDILIEQTSLEKEIKNLIIYKKALFIADTSNENQLLKVLKPILNPESIWTSHALYLLAEYFYYKDEKQKSKEFFNQILNLKKPNQDIVKETQKRLSRDLSD